MQCRKDYVKGRIQQSAIRQYTRLMVLLNFVYNKGFFRLSLLYRNGTDTQVC